jgi:uncharacterized YigZ family protein
MLFDESFFVLASEGKSHLREKGSRFFGYAFPVRTEADVKEKLHLLQTQYPDATHHCYAYQLGPNKFLYRANDDGEPSNSAGKPILRAIQKKNTTDALVVVVRYFGGTMLGIPGLIKAYGDTASLALNETQFIEKSVLEKYSLTSNYEQENVVFKLVKTVDIQITKIEKTEHLEVFIEGTKTNADALKMKLPEFPGLTLRYLGETY